ncbi:hypothetical protein KTS45_13290 [Halomicroarcula limicola]|uniref:Adenylosuccinate lyase C-terminal domain-containing protein n=1 Tax=Haloarcula limicola TaxID=1429915 RepID=A0A8J7YB12_9EURY|nr:hypothetical protein [Halomicroarcula limicola]
MITLAEHVGRQTAHGIVHDNAMDAIETGRNFRDCLLADERVTEHLSEAHGSHSVYRSLGITRRFGPRLFRFSTVELVSRLGA